MPDAARIGDMHACPKVEPGPVPHVGGPILSGSANVIIGYSPAARVGDSIVCFPVGPADSVQDGSPTVLINFRDAARKTDPSSHGGQVTAGCPTVIIGGSPQSMAMFTAARRATPFCEECERRRREMDDRDDSAEIETDTVTLVDDEPPVGALLGAALSAADGFTPQELAVQPDQADGLDDLRRSARYAVAYQFYAAHGGDKLKPSRIWSHIGGIDISQPVEVVDIAGRTLYQRGVPGAGTGQYFALDPAVAPEQLGVSEQVYPLVDGEPTPPPVPRDRRVIAFDDEVPALGLKSTAAAITDTWSMPPTIDDPGQIVPCDGGGTQLMVPKVFHAGASLVLP
ncbi:PAAR domain-containing protein [Nannocystis bainbridge]|uniref:PAAR domain-containing protein n=1 Tax=Nannocystis bainbridge TaxID=2995303 RepID=A0ABT5DW26_9BACT|nr:PAAR domain-containing protein [Nannocystis bainbridge]MDC0716612.1 PAAR domain-containing protein [Nannocystis bainbridge]